MMGWLVLTLWVCSVWACLADTDIHPEDRRYTVYQDVTMDRHLKSALTSGIIACELWCHETVCCTAFNFQPYDTCHGNCTLFAGIALTTTGSEANDGQLVYVKGEYGIQFTH